MTRRLRVLLLASAATALFAGAANAQEYDPGWYVRGDLGYSIDGSFNQSDDGLFNWGEAGFEDDFAVFGGAGYSWASGLRVEGELGWRTNDIENRAGLDNGGSSDIWSGMINAFYDFNRGGSWQPYIGLGAGGALMDVTGSDIDPDPTIFFESDETVFAWQGIVGIGWQVSEQMIVDLGYRYFEAPDVEFTASATDIEGEFFSFEGEADYVHEAVTLGIRYDLQPPPPPPPPPAPPPPPPRPAPPPAASCPTSQFVVYFEWDQSDLNQEAQETIGTALQRARQCNISAVAVVGHTDTSGSPEYNQALSERRAGVVRDALVAGGLPAGGITTEGRGETELAQATADGVREPLNRRSAVTISFR